MVVKVYISRDSNGAEQHFRETYERSAALQVAKIFWRTYHPVKNKFYALVFNLQSPPADLIVMSNDGLGVVDMKHIGNPVEGDENTPWYIVQDNGARTLIENNHVNPARQVSDYKRDININLKAFASGQDSIPKWLSRGEFFTQGAVLFTSDRFSTDGIRLGHSYTRWLNFLWLDTIAEWAQSLSFQTKRTAQRLSLNSIQIDLIATNLFKCSQWTEIDGFLTGGNPYGYLFLIEGNQRKLRFSLETEVVNIGRSKDNDISLESQFVSAKHCRIYHKPDGTYLEDLGSGNGTRLDGQSLNIGEQRKLQSGNEIVLGPLENGQPHENSIVLKYMAATESKTAETVIYKG